MSKFQIPNLTAVVPVYNEEAIVAQVISELKTELGRLDIESEIIAVNDASQDRSGQILENIQGIKVIHHAQNRGYGASLKTGIRESKHDWILIIDADGTYPVSAIGELLAHAGQYDMVSGLRSGKNHDARWLYMQRTGKFILRKLAGYVAGQKIKDINCGLRIFNKKVAQEFWHLYSDKFSFTTTSLSAFLSHGYPVKFVPIDYHPRHGKSSIRPVRDFTNFLSLIFKIALFFKPLKVFTPISLFLFLAAIFATFYSIFYVGEFMDTTVILLAVTSLQTLFFGLIATLIVNRQPR